MSRKQKKSITEATTPPRSRMVQLPLFQDDVQAPCAEQEPQREKQHEPHICSDHAGYIHQSPKAYLQSLFGCWDGVPRLDKVPADILGGTPSVHNIQAIRELFRNAITRALDPGSRVETACILQGASRNGKSLFFYTLSDPWHAHDVYGGVQYPPLPEHTWMWEIEEIGSGFEKEKNAKEVTSLLFARRDVYNTSDGVTERLRSCVPVGTTSRDVIPNRLGNHRRYNIIETGALINIELCKEWRHQLWAEAIVRCAER